MKNKRNGVYLTRHSDAVKRTAELEAAKAERLGKSKTLDLFICDTLSKGEILTEFDEDIWAAVIDCVTVYADSSMVFKFKNGAEIKE